MLVICGLSNHEKYTEMLSESPLKVERCSMGVAGNTGCETGTLAEHRAVKSAKSGRLCEAERVIPVEGGSIGRNNLKVG